MRKVMVHCNRSYPVYIGTHMYAQLGQHMAKRNGRALVVTDETVNTLYCWQVCEGLKEIGYEVSTHVIAPGENSKSFTTYEGIIRKLVDNHFTKRDVVIALGGGVVGDIAGFAASTYLRGIRLIQMPTTLLAMVDSSVGGKTAINIQEGKNQIGTFYQPEAVYCNMSTLESLPKQEEINGLGEILKYGVLEEPKLLMDMETVDENLVAKCVEIKNSFVSKDEFDQGIRQYLNLGHTIGHAIECCSNYTIQHGLAVATGLFLIAKVGEKLGITNRDTVEQIEKYMIKYGFTRRLVVPIEDIKQAMLRDKKRIGDDVVVIIPTRLGSCERKRIKIDELVKLIEETL